MKRSLITLSAVAALATTSFATIDIDKKFMKLEKKIKKLEKKIKKSNKKLNIVKAHDAGDNIKWDVNFRTAVDSIEYTHANGTKSKNGGLLTNKLVLGMKFKADPTTTFYGSLVNYKVFGDTANHSQANTKPGYADFDWLTSSNPTGNSLKVREAYFLYANDSFMNNQDISWTASIGRRPSMDGLGINFREGEDRKSALAHIINVEVDAASFRWNLGKVTPMEGSWFKLCWGRGLSNATPRFTQAGTDYANDTTKQGDIDMLGFIFVPYNDGQYSVHTQWSTAHNMIGFTNTEINKIMSGSAGTFQDVGDLTLMTAMFKADGIGEDINDYLNDTTFFASYAQSKTDPTATASEGGMLGSANSETGHSSWIGVQAPCVMSDDARIGLEWNKGSKYWRSVTYAEDTIVGSKIAARGTAIEAYWLKPLTRSLSMSIRHTQIKYDYTGSNGFFGADGTPMTMAQAQAAGQNPVEKATDTRVAISYKF